MASQELLISTPNYIIRTASASRQTNLARRALLPAYPTHRYEERPPYLLLPNVHTIDRDLMEILSYSGDNNPGDFNFCPFTFNIDMAKQEFLPSFMISFYRKLFVETSERWNIPMALIDYNLVRLQSCMSRHSQQCGESAIGLIDELPLALEFYLQIDIDLFFLKTCNYGNAQPRLIGGDDTKKEQQREGLFCQLAPIAQYGMKRCHHQRCHLCQTNRISTIQFTEQQIHRFVNGYEAILNCPATCETSNIIYALTCPCTEYDYIGSTADSLYQRTLQHREEGHRMIREFLFGSTNIQRFLDQDKRKAVPLLDSHDQLLYHHSAVCRHGLQRFLNQNSKYWCFVPQTSADAQADNQRYQQTKKKSKSNDDHDDEQATSKQPMLFASILVDRHRTKEESSRFVRDIPQPPSGYEFSERQCDEQFQFFFERKETQVASADYVDLYNYSIIAVLPDTCSRHLRRFIEALFITHTETKLNMIGRLTHRYPYMNYDKQNRGQWCSNLIRPSNL